eukprot:CAMPEP_0194379034 /NCGR_PEP_ID=MMETSP0174-20130528/37622_1 /TAXON_ID=216777 /ORGANISM="Proboscia alata, Strain PI-D3" /LENGTH=492 /DNA_ID=CAMNT_0039161449 /DNA_START=133 /DNA_END=1608 /DNA_ORIENTATION=+
MRVSSTALLLLSSSYQISNHNHNAVFAFSNVAPQQRRLSSSTIKKPTINLRPSTLKSAQPSNTESQNTDILVEISSGKNLVINSADNHNNHFSSLPGAEAVLDFASVKNSQSKGELALSAARKTFESTNDVAEALLTYSTNENELMGINSDVIELVGHPLGTYATSSSEIQEVAEYLRSRASKGSFPVDTKAPANVGDNAARYETILKKATEESGEVTAAFAKTFYLGTQLMPEEAREAIWAIYVWCRRTDEIVDAPRDNDEDMLRDLSAWEIRLERLWEHGEIVDVLDLPLLDVRIKYPNLSIQPFMDMIRGMLMDIPDLGQERYEDFDQLHLYCYRVAGTVGLMSMPIFGCADGFNEEVAKEPALSLGVAFQITNILRDIGEDASTRNRIYLPRDDMARFGVKEEDIYAQKVTPEFIEFMKYQVSRTRRYYARALRGVPMLHESARLPVQSSLDCYGKILDKIEENNYDCLTKRAYVGKWEKLSIIPFSW